MNTPRSNTSYLSPLEALRRREDLLRIFIFTLVTIFVWIGFEIYLSQQKTDVPEDFQKYVLPLNPNINRSALQEIEGRRGFSEEELGVFVPQIEVTIPTTIEEATPEPDVATSIPVASTQPSPTPIPTAIQ